MAVSRLTNSQEKRERVVSRPCRDSLLGADAAQVEDFLRRLLLDHVDDVVDRQHADKAAAVVGHGGGEEIVLLEAEGDVVCSSVTREHRLLVVHDGGDLASRRLAQQPRQRHHADEVEGRIDDIDLDEVVRQVRSRGR